MLLLMMMLMLMLWCVLQEELVPCDWVHRSLEGNISVLLYVFACVSMRMHVCALLYAGACRIACGAQRRTVV